MKKGSLVKRVVLLLAAVVTASTAAIGAQAASRTAPVAAPTTVPTAAAPQLPPLGGPALFGLPEPTEAEIAAQVALAQPPAPPVLSSAAQQAAGNVVDRATKEERKGDKPQTLDGDWLTSVPDAIKAKHSGDEAEKAIKTRTTPPKAKSDKKQFALYTGGPSDIKPDGSAGPKRFQNLPVWIVTYSNVPGIRTVLAHRSRTASSSTSSTTRPVCH